MKVDKENKKQLKIGSLVRFRNWTCEVFNISDIDSGIIGIKDIQSGNEAHTVNVYSCHILSIG